MFSPLKQEMCPCDSFFSKQVWADHADEDGAQRMVGQ